MPAESHSKADISIEKVNHGESSTINTESGTNPAVLKTLSYHKTKMISDVSMDAAIVCNFPGEKQTL